MSLTPVPPLPRGAPSSGGSVLAYLGVLLRRWRLLVVAPMVTGVVAALVSFLLPVKWTASVAFVPEAASNSPLPASLGNLAGQFGIQLSGAGSAESPAFYTQLVTSDELLNDLLTTRFITTDRAPGDSAPLLDLLRIQTGNPLLRLERGRLKLKKMLTTGADNQSNIVRIAVQAPDPRLAAAMANRIGDLLNTFNLRKRHVQGSERRRFVEAQLALAGDSLAAAEDSLRAFVSHNRLYNNDPTLTLDYGRLERQVQVRQEVYLTLRREFESARIQELNDTPVLTAVDTAAVPQERSAPRRGRIVIVSFILAVVCAVGLAFVAEYFANLRIAEPGEYQRMANAWMAVQGDVRRALPGHRPREHDPGAP